MRRSTTPQLVPILTAGRHRSPRQGACFMEFASFLAGERWSDHPACTHPLLAALARDVNDLTSDAARDKLMPLVTRVVGRIDVDPIRVALRAASAAMPVASLDRQRALGVGLLMLRSAGASEEAVAAAFDGNPDAERWATEFIARTPRQRFTDRTCEAVVHTSVVGIALACIPDADDRLRTLLQQVIEDAEAATAPAAVPQAPALAAV